MNELISQLTSQIGVNPDQAKGGLGVLLNFAKEKLSDGDFGQISSLIDGATDAMSAAPAAGEASSGGGLLGQVASMASSVGIGGDSLKGLAGLTSAFDSLGLDAGSITKFIPVVLSFVESKGGSTAKGILEKVLS